jgi:hypothetical protein
MEKHLLEAAERGDAEVQFNLGIIYENGWNDSRYVVEGNRAEAVRWLLAAAEQGLPRAQIKLAEMYAGEPDIPESSVKACGWYLLAMTSLRGAHLQKAQSAYHSNPDRPELGDIHCASSVPLSFCAYRLCHPNVVPMETAEPSNYGGGAVPPRPRRGRDTRVGSSRSAVQHDRSATVSVA